MPRALQEPAPDGHEETNGPPLSVEEKLDIIAHVIFKMAKQVDEIQLELFQYEEEPKQ